MISCKINCTKNHKLGEYEPLAIMIFFCEITTDREKKNSILVFKKVKRNIGRNEQNTDAGFKHTDASFEGNRYNQWANSLSSNSQLL